MKKQFISIIGAFIGTMLLSAAAQAATTTIINDNFSDNSIGAYVTNYDGTLSIDNGALKNTADNSWNSSNGIKKDITSELKAAGIKKGDSLKISMKVSSAWYDNPAKASVVIGDNTILIASGGPGGQSWTSYTLEGTAEVTIDIGSDYTAYFTATQPCGNVNYDDIKLELIQADEETTTEEPTEEATEAPSAEPAGEFTEIFNTTGKSYDELTELISSDITIYQSESQTPTISVNRYGYNGSDGSRATISISGSYKYYTGIKIDITDKVKKGDIVKADFALYSTNQDAGIIAAILQGSTVADTIYTGTVDTTNQWMEYSTSEATVTSTEDKVYLAIENKSGAWQLRNIVIYVASPAETEEPTPETAFTYEQAAFEGSLDGAELKDDGKVLYNENEAVTVYKCSYTGEAANGLKVTVTADENESAEGTIETSINGDSSVVFYVLTNREEITSLTAVPIE